ncbi:hypothetical protein ACQPU1_09155 [Clostridium paraputrificum]|uniref:hypothetical protein n=1 Tax=Clostridium TaxID=1485 RepID=UPI003D329D59
MNFDSIIFVNLYFIISIILMATTLFAFVNRNSQKVKHKILSTSSSIIINSFKSLVIEDYLSFEKYQIWRYTTYKRVPSNF